MTRLTFRPLTSPARLTWEDRRENWIGIVAGPKLMAPLHRGLGMLTSRPPWWCEPEGWTGSAA